ncbi:MAG: hypothetical protein WC091_17030, partial [Sulfuricellaceae bacterium]
LAGCDARRKLRRVAVPHKQFATQQRARETMDKCANRGRAKYKVISRSNGAALSPSLQGAKMGAWQGYATVFFATQWMNPAGNHLTLA